MEKFISLSLVGSTFTIMPDLPEKKVRLATLLKSYIPNVEREAGNERILPLEFNTALKNVEWYGALPTLTSKISQN